jgi:hypothetical protein
MVTARCVCAGLGDEVLMQFGRVDKNRFTMDVRYPLSPFQVCDHLRCHSGTLMYRYYAFRRLLCVWLVWMGN